MSKMLLISGNQKRPRRAIFRSEKIDCKSKAITTDRAAHYIMKMWSICQEDITIVKIYICSIRATTFIRQILKDLKGKIENNTIIIKGFNTPLSTMDRSSTRNQ